MEEIGTETLRKLASRWTLAGDERLLTILQNTHQRLLARCQDANCQLEQMASVLDDASIRLQNVNNQFMSLSSSQFIESRVYDDDVDVTTANATGKEAPTPAPPDELAMLKRSVAVIDSNHEVITIVDDSDTSDTDDELPDRQVMKAKDMYEDRPLPYIIGSEPWKNKWHAGLVVEDSDTDSSTSKVERESDQYSHSEPEDYGPSSATGLHETLPEAHVTNMSESSSDLPSEATPTVKPTPSDVASEIARRLGAGLPPPKAIEREPEYEEPARPAARPIYRPQEPVASTIFPDEPPPLEYQTDSDTDIFADLHRNQPYRQPYIRQNVTEELFGKSEAEDAGDIFSDFANQPSMTKPTSLFDAGPKPHMFDKQHIATESPSRGQAKIAEQSARNIQQPNVTVDTVDEKAVKKPVGGISLFGSNKGAENIGAAILRRHQRQSSSDDGSGSDTLSQPSHIKQQPKKEKDIFDDLFAKNQNKKVMPKANNINKDIKENIKINNGEKMKKDTPKPVDLFSDNLFDDIDDIFTTNVVKTTKNSKNTIFEDDDGLFSDITNNEIKKTDVNVNKNKDKNGLFDSDDDLFSEKPTPSSKPASNKAFIGNKTITKEVIQPNKITNTTSLFDDDDENIFSDTKINNATGESDNFTTPIETSKTVTITSPSIFDDNDDDASDLFKESIKSSNLIQNKLSTNSASHRTSGKIETKTIEENSKTLKSNNDFNTMSSKYDNKTFNNTATVNKSPPRSVKTFIRNEPTTKNDSTLNKQEPVAFKNTNSDDEVAIVKRPVGNISDTEEFPKQVIDTSKTNVIKNAHIGNTFNNSKTLDEDINDKNVDDHKHKNKSEQNTGRNLTPDLNTNRESVKSPHIDNNKTNVHNTLDDDIFALEKDNKGKFKSDVTTNDNDSDGNNISNSDIFNDILSEPPVFEKPKEPKKSKNVNALFDDDSDDESLFFKKDDVVSDDNAEEIIPTQNKLFNIFTDVPPEEVFNKEEEENENINYGLFSTVPSSNITEEKSIENSYPSDKESKIKNTREDKPEQESSQISVSETKEKIGDIFKLLSDESSEKIPPMTEKDNEINDAFSNSIFKSSTLTKGEEEIFGKHHADITDDVNDLFNQGDTKTPSIKESGDIFKRVTNLKSNIANNDGYLSDDNDDGLFQSLPAQLCNPTSKLSATSDQDEEQYQSLPNIDTSKLGKGETSILSDPNHEKVQPVSPVEKTEKKVGKLKIGLNINVKALLPGASPIKVKTVDSLDGQSQSNVKVENELPKLVQAVDFESKLDSEILDNKLSKERPRIQVKRRPSTRKARKEAVRKSGINFGDDSTDNSSSIDDPPKNQNEIHTDTVKNIEIAGTHHFGSAADEDIVQKTKETDEDRSYDKEIVQKAKEGDEGRSYEENIVQKAIGRDEHRSYEENIVQNAKETDDDISKNVTESVISEHKPIQTEIQIADTQTAIQSIRPPAKSNSTTKIVYILNDEDIFNTSAIETSDIKKDLFKENLVQKPENVLNVSNISDNVISNSIKIVDKDFDSQDASLSQESGIKTLGKTYDVAKGDVNKSSLFGEDDSDEIFKNKKPVVKASIFDSDSDGELFGVNKKAEVKKIEKVPVKGSLFGDDDDDDLFGVKTKKTNETQPQPKPMPSAKETSASTQPVFEDPLTMFDDDDV